MKLRIPFNWSLDARALDDTLKRGSTALGSMGMLQRVAAPLAQTVGDLSAQLYQRCLAHESVATRQHKFLRRGPWQGCIKLDE